MSVHDALPGDIYVDVEGKLWRCVWTCHSPTIGMEAVEPEPIPYGAKRRLEGAMSGLMWEGFKRIWRKET